MDIIGWIDEDIYTRGPILDKNGNELRIGDTVHYKRDAREYEMNGRTRTLPARDIKFVIDGFKNNPMVKSKYHTRGFEDPIWVTGEGFYSTNFRKGDKTRNAVSPRALVKIDTFVKKTKMDLTFVKPSKRLHVTESPKLTIFEKIRQLFG
jgi:hypothetical protein